MQKYIYDNVIHLAQCHDEVTVLDLFPNTSSKQAMEYTRIYHCKKGEQHLEYIYPFTPTHY